MMALWDCFSWISCVASLQFALDQLERDSEGRTGDVNGIAADQSSIESA